MNWSDDELGRMKYLHAADDVFDTVPLWRRHFYNDYALEGAAYLAISASDPENLRGVDHGRIVRAQQASGAALKDFDRLQMCGGFPWCIASIPIPSWAEKVFPGKADAVERLWSAIFAAVRITGDGTAVEQWRAHLRMLEARREKLNALRFRSLHYRNGLGTDLTIRLPENHLWAAGNSVTPKGQTFIANMPTEEIFTAPLRDGVDGVVYASMPLSHDGNIVDKFWMKVEKGRITEVHAQTGEETLRQVKAEGAEGIYVRADNTNSALRALTSEVKKMKKADIESKVYSQYDEQYQGLAWIALVLLLIDFFIVDRKNSWLKKITFFS